MNIATFRLNLILLLMLALLLSPMFLGVAMIHHGRSGAGHSPLERHAWTAMGLVTLLAIAGYTLGKDLALRDGASAAAIHATQAR